METLTPLKRDAVREFKSVKEEADEIYRQIIKTSSYNGIVVDKVILKANHAVVTGWDIMVDLVKGNYIYDIRDDKYAPTVTLIPDSGSVLVAVGRLPGETRAVVVYKD